MLLLGHILIYWMQSYFLTFCLLALATEAIYGNTTMDQVYGAPDPQRGGPPPMEDAIYGVLLSVCLCDILHCAVFLSMSCVYVIRALLCMDMSAFVLRCVVFVPYSSYAYECMSCDCL